MQCGIRNQECIPAVIDTIHSPTIDLGKTASSQGDELFETESSEQTQAKSTIMYKSLAPSLLFCKLRKVCDHQLERCRHSQSSAKRRQRVVMRMLLDTRMDVLKVPTSEQNHCQSICERRKSNLGYNKFANGDLASSNFRGYIGKE